MKQRLYIDVNSGVGRMSRREKGIPYKVETLLNEMNYCRVHASVIYSNVARDYAFTKGNFELVDDVKKSTRLYGIATVIPDIQYELDEGWEYYDWLLDQGIKGFKVYPKTLNHGFDAFNIEKLAFYMTDKGIPLVTEIGETDWKDLRSILIAFPELKVLLCNTSWATNRYLFPLMEKFKNLHFEISSNQTNDILDICKKHFGIERIHFGSNYPHRILGGIKSLVEYSGLKEDEKDMVAYKNAARLFNINTHEIETYNEDECLLDEIALKVDCGEPLDNIPVIDAHTHMVDTSHKTVSMIPMLNSDEDSLIRHMDRLGIDRIITSPWEGIMTNGTDANETSLKARSKYGERIEVYATCNPHYAEDLEKVVKIYHEEHKFIGIKPYWPRHKYDLLGDKYRKWFEYGDRNHLIMLIHSGNKEIAQKVEELSKMYSNMAFILAHSGISYEVADYNIEVAKRSDNVFLEITFTTMTNGIIEYMVKEAGADKILFGTDQPMRDPAPQLAWIAYSKISVEDKKKILGGNILKLIERAYR